MKSLQEIAIELRDQLPSACTVEFDSECEFLINVYKKYCNLWLQIEFDTLNEVMNENELMMWMRMEKIDKFFVPVFHIHRHMDKVED